MSSTDRPGSPTEPEGQAEPDGPVVPADRVGAPSETAPAPSETASAGEVTIRRAPKFGVFIVGGGVLGFIATVIVVAATMDLDRGVAASNDGTTTSADVGFWGLVGYFALYGVTAGLVVGALVAVVLDWRLSKRAAKLTAERLDIQMPVDTVDGEVDADEDDRR
ncbi:hypothetical protein [Curtobacterium sp. Leaf261]|uniref:hypothetical protein n=1 Tax=Curtobacterium sp. Leaf261 TaxID=1736311 RepID=UPI0006F300DB|nr:hypothetical protein [Curtobacterium sp. Leaf261]KQO61475.1 hypothetical protein ASF23_13535 [Curtobacterium sp. Leaf261]